MDLPLWDSSDDQGYLTSFAYESGNYTEDHLPCYFSFGYGHDLLEEDALNEKSCMQVLKTWIDKADEDIVKLEEDILMLRCHLVWDDKDWSRQCSAGLREKIDHLDILIQSLNENRGNDLRLQTEELPPRLHDLLKPLLENYLAKPKHTENSTVQIPQPTAIELSNEKSKPGASKDCKITEENVCPIMLKTYERKSKSTEHEESHPREKRNAVATEFEASSHKCPENEVSENFVSKPSILERRRSSNLVHAESERSLDKSEPADTMVKESASTSIEKVNSREKEEMNNAEEKEEKSKNHSDALPEVRVIQGRLQCQSKVTLTHLKSNETGSQISKTVEVDSVEPRTDASSKVRKARVYRRATKRDERSVKPSVKIKGKNTKLSEKPEVVKALETKTKISSRTINGRMEHVKKPIIELDHQFQMTRDIEIVAVNQAKLISPEAVEALTEMNKTPCAMNDGTKHVNTPIMELKHQFQVQQTPDIANVAVTQAKLISPLEPEGRGPHKKWKENPEAAEALQTEMEKNPCSMNEGIEHAKKPRLELENQIQVQQRQDIETVAVNQAKLISPLKPKAKPEGRGPHKKSNGIPEILQNSFEAEHIDKGPSSTENLMGQKKHGVAEWMSKNGKKETQQRLDKIHTAGTSVIPATPILLPQTTCKKDDLSSSRMKLGKMEHDASNSTAEEATDGAKILPQTSSICVKIDKSEITCNYLRAVAKSRKLRGYYKLKKEELLTYLGFS